MKKFLLIILMLPMIALSHPGIGIVKDSKGNIYYTDLQKVWKISNGVKTVIVPHVHTHELYMDKNDNLYGEDEQYDAGTQKFYHRLWIYRPNGKMDTVIGMREAYIEEEFSLARDKYGNQYYTKAFLHHPDTTHIYRRTPEGKESVFATGNVKGASWLYAYENGSLLFVIKNAIYGTDTAGNISLVKEGIADPAPSFAFSRNDPKVWSAWQDNAGNIYAAVFSDQAVKKIDSAGNVTTVYTSQDNWTPLHGVFDNENRLWVLEGSDKNDVRVMLAGVTAAKVKDAYNIPIYLLAGGIASGLMLLYIMYRSFAVRRQQGKPIG